MIRSHLIKAKYSDASKNYLFLLTTNKTTIQDTNTNRLRDDDAKDGKFATIFSTNWGQKNSKSLFIFNKALV